MKDSISSCLLCACGCGERVPDEPKRRGPARRYVDRTHLMRAYMRRYRARKKILQKRPKKG